MPLGRFSPPSHPLEIKNLSWGIFLHIYINIQYFFYQDEKCYGIGIFYWKTKVWKSNNRSQITCNKFSTCTHLTNTLYVRLWVLNRKKTHHGREFFFKITKNKTNHKDDQQQNVYIHFYNPLFFFHFFFIFISPRLSHNTKKLKKTKK